MSENEQAKTYKVYKSPRSGQWEYDEMTPEEIKSGTLAHGAWGYFPTHTKALAFRNNMAEMEAVMQPDKNEQVYEFQPPKPYHPQQRFGSGILAADQAYPNLARYYGEGFQANFTTLDLLDSLAARVKELEDQGALGMEIAKRYDAQFQRMVTEVFAEPVKPAWWKRVLLRVGVLSWDKVK